MLTFDDIAFLRRTLSEQFGLRLQFDRTSRGCSGRMTVPPYPLTGRSVADTESAAALYNKLADMHVDAPETEAA